VDLCKDALDMAIFKNREAHHFPVFM